MAFHRKAAAPLLLLALCLFPDAALCEQAVHFPFAGLVTGSGVNLRSGPGLSYEILLQLARMSKLRVLGEQGPWFSVELPEGIPAYIHRAFVGETVEGWALVKGERVQVRVRPSDGATSWGALSEPDKVRVLGSYGEWIKIQPPPFCRGWVHKEYVTFMETS